MSFDRIDDWPPMSATLDAAARAMPDTGMWASLFQSMPRPATARQAAKPSRRRRSRARPDPKDGFVYFVQCGGSEGRIKIGKAGDVAVRLAELATASPATLNLLATMGGGRKAEREMHERFRHLRRHREWFDPSPDLLAFIAAITMVAT